MPRVSNNADDWSLLHEPIVTVICGKDSNGRCSITLASVNRDHRTHVSRVGSMSLVSVGGV